MKNTPRTFPDYATALRLAFEEEIAGEAFYAALVERFSGREAAILHKLARMERRTATLLVPALARAGLVAGDAAALAAEGRAEAADHKADWPAFLRRMAEDYPAYVAEMCWMASVAPVDDAEAMAVLVAHEQAMVDFARAERAGEAASLDHLDAWLARHGA